MAHSSLEERPDAIFFAMTIPGTWAFAGPGATFR
jgi:hypothetical protein